MTDLDIPSKLTMAVRLVGYDLENQRYGGLSQVHRQRHERIPHRSITAVQLKRTRPSPYQAGFIQFTGSPRERNEAPARGRVPTEAARR